MGVPHAWHLARWLLARWLRGCRDRARTKENAHEEENTQGHPPRRREEEAPHPRQGDRQDPWSSDQRPRWLRRWLGAVDLQARWLHASGLGHLTELGARRSPARTIPLRAARARHRRRTLAARPSEATAPREQAERRRSRRHPGEVTGQDLAGT